MDRFANSTQIAIFIDADLVIAISIVALRLLLPLVAPKKNSITGEMDMAKCNECGKKGIFLKVNARGFCKDCQPIVLIF